MKRLLNAVLIFMILVVFMFVGVSSVMAFNSSVAVNQSGSGINVERLLQNSANFATNYLGTMDSKNYMNTGTSASTLPEPTFHVGKIQPLMV